MKKTLGTIAISAIIVASPGASWADDNRTIKPQVDPFGRNICEIIPEECAPASPVRRDRR